MSLSITDPFLRVIDLETTGNNFTDGGVVEIGWQDVAPAVTTNRGVTNGGAADGPGWALRGLPRAILIDPGVPISSSTAAIHHIIDEDVAGAPRWQHAAPDILRAAPGAAPIALVAHRSSFEQRWCIPTLTGGLPWICTYKCALRIWPDAPGHSNQGLRYSRRPEGLDRALGLPAHRAGPDAYVTAHHLRDMLAQASVADLLRWSAEPALLVKVPFGRLRGRRVRDLDDAQLEMLLADSVSNVDLAFTARMERQRRVDQAATSAGPAQAALFD